MKLTHFLSRPAALALLWGVTGALLLSSGRLVADHISAIQELRATALPLAQEIPVLERRAKILTDQQELSELSDALRVGSPEESVHVYALPKETEIAKVVSSLDAFLNVLQKNKLLASRSPITLGNVRDAGDDLMAQEISMRVAINGEGLHSLETFIRLTGLLTVADALSADDRTQLLHQTETENPAAIVALEQFFQTDLLTYIREPRPAEEQLLKSFSTQIFERTFRDVIKGSVLPEAERFVTGSFLQTLADHQLWPMQMLSIGSISLKAGSAEDWYTADIVLEAYARK